MKFGKEFKTHLEESLPEWRDKFLCYKPLKKLLKNIPTSPNSDASADLRDCFISTLNEELEKFNDFYVDKEEEFIIRFQDLKERIDHVNEKMRREGALKSESDFSGEMMEIRKDFVSIHGEMVLLKNYSSLNFAGLVKILKKYDKRTGGLLCLPFTQLALHQPFFTTEPLTRLVHECEEKLELLFPLEAEVVESTHPLGNQGGEPYDDASEISSKTNMSLGEETGDIYRSTLAAMRTIQGLKRASSTYNPLSFSALFNQDNDSTGDVTSENSAESFPGELDDDETNQDFADSPK